MMQGLEPPASPLLAATELSPVYDQPLSPSTPPGSAHEFPEPQDTTGQARRRATAGLSTRMGSQVLYKVLSVSAPTINNSSTTYLTTTSLTTTSATTLTISPPTVLSALAPSTSSDNIMVNDSWPFQVKYGVHYLYVESITGS